MASKNQRQFWDLSEKDDWRTPLELVNDLAKATDGIDTDPCAHPKSSIGDVNNYRLEDGQNGLELPWMGTVFVNPPFGHKAKWLNRTIGAVENGNARTVIVLTPDSTDTKSWWHEYIAPHSNLVCFLEGRLSYLDSDGVKQGSPTFGTAISVFGYYPPMLIETLQEWGHVVRTM